MNNGIPKKASNAWTEALELLIFSPRRQEVARRLGRTSGSLNSSTGDRVQSWPSFSVGTEAAPLRAAIRYSQHQRRHRQHPQPIHRQHRPDGRAKRRRYAGKKRGPEQADLDLDNLNGQRC